MSYNPAAQSGPAGVRRSVGVIWDQAGMLVVLAVVFICCSIFVPHFLSGPNMIALLLAVSTVGMIACTMLFCLASGDFDLSISAVVACAGVLTAVIIDRTGSITLGITGGLALGAIVGLVNGLVVAKLHINALITTLATMQIVRGLGYIVTKGNPVGIGNADFFVLGSSAWLHVPVPVWIMVACFVFFGFVLRSTTFGRNTLAIGGNKEAARLAGIPVDRIKIVIFTVQGIVAAFAGIILASRMTSGQPSTSQGLELEVISACVLGGVSLTGGIGSMGFVIAGVLIMGIVQNAMNLSNIPPFYQYLVRGTILLIAVIADEMKRLRSR